MSVEELLRAVLCPNIGADQTPPRDTNTVFVHPTTTEYANQVAEKINRDRENRALIVADMENGAGDAIVGAIPFPSMRAASEAGDKMLAYEMGVIAAKEAINAGYHWTFGPCVDILGNRYSPIVSLRTAGLAKSGDYDLIVCSVIETCSWAINTARLNGPVCRNMMRGWMRYDTPVVFISNHSVAFEDTYKPVVDTLINTYGATKYTAPAVVNKFFR